MKSNKIRNRIILVCGVLLIVVAAAFIPKKNKMMGRPAGEPGMGGAANETVYSVTSQTVEKTELQEYLTMNGNVQAGNTISVYPEIGGKIIKVYVTLGSEVKRGQKIAEIDPSSPGSYYQSSPVYAPISGTITSLPLTVGTSVTSSTAVATIGEINFLQIKANVPERDIAVLKTNLKADVSLVAYKGEVFHAHVISVSPIVDETSRTKELYFAFDESDSRVNAGMYAKVKLYTTLHQDVIVIPYDSVLNQNDQNYVFVINEDSTVSVRNVELGVNVDGMVEVLSGLQEGEKIVVSGNQSLTEGVKVKELS